MPSSAVSPSTCEWKRRILGKIISAVLLLFFVFTAPSTADIISAKIRSHNRDVIVFSEFEYSHTGYVSVAVSSVAISSIPVTSNLSQPDPSRIGFFLLSDQFLYRYYQEFKQNPDLCSLDIKYISVLFTFQDLSPPPHSSFNKSYHVTYSGTYSLCFANCNDQSLLTMDVRTELYSTDDEGTTKDYLSAGQPQPSFFFRLFLIYLCFLGFWIFISLKNQQYFQRIHLLMGVLLFITLVHYLCAMADQQELKVTGSHHGWHTLLYIFQFMKNVLLFTVIVLLNAEWCFRKPFLLGGEIFILMIVILLQVWANVRSVAVVESGPVNDQDLQHLIDKFMLIDFICCLVVGFHCFNWALTSKEEEATDTSKETSATARPNMFPAWVIVYILYSRGMNFPLVVTAAREAGNLVFYMVMFYMHKPILLEEQDLNCKGFLDHTGV